MNEVTYFTIRAQLHSQLAKEASDPDLKTAYEAIAADMSAKVATADPNRKVVLVDGVGVDSGWSPGRRPSVDILGDRAPSLAFARTLDRGIAGVPRPAEQRSQHGPMRTQYPIDP